MTGTAVTALLLDWSNGDRGALERLMPLVYGELHNIARRHLSREDPDHTLQSTALVHEAYLRLVDQNRVQWQNRAHFFAVAAQLVRRILLDHARRRHAEKRGGMATRLTLDEGLLPERQRSIDILSLDEALNALAELDPQQARAVELRFFAGLTIAETAEAMGISATTVQRYWISAKAWLFDRLSGSGKRTAS